jgi:hypothetical protein
MVLRIVLDEQTVGDDGDLEVQGVAAITAALAPATKSEEYFEAPAG